MKKNYLIVVMSLFLISSAVVFSGCSGKEEPAGEESHAGHDHAEHEGEGNDEHAEAEVDSHGHEEGVHEENMLAVSAHYKELLELKVAKVSARRIEKTITIVGEIARDFEKKIHVTSNVDGKVVKLNAHLGDHHLKKGELLAVVEGNNGETVDIKAPESCLIIGEHIEEGENVDTNTSLFTMADMSSLRANFDVYLEDTKHIRTGQDIKVESSVYPEKLYPGRITFISPLVDEKTRTVKIRVNINNYDCSLKLGMFLKGYVKYSNASSSIVVPGAAIQRWEGAEMVFVPEGEYEYEVREVKTGLEDKEYIEILSGLEIGEEVVSAGSFHLKSELRRRSSGDTGHGHAH